MFRENELPKRRTAINVLLTGGGMGDLLCYLVTTNYMVTELKHVDPLIWVPDYLLDFAKNVLPKEAKVYNYTTALKKYNNEMTGVTTEWKGLHSARSIHPIDYANHMLIDNDLPMEKKNYLKFDNSNIDISQFNLPEKYVCISTGSTAKTKELPITILNQITDYVIEKGYVPVFIGKAVIEAGAGPKMTASLAEIDYYKGINLTNKCSLIETAAIITKSTGYIGVEGGLTHLAGFTDVPMVVGYTFADPARMSPIRNNQHGYNMHYVLPDESLKCKYCVSRVSLLYNHDFKNCMYDDYLCVKQLTIDKWKRQLDKIL